MRISRFHISNFRNIREQLDLVFKARTVHVIGPNNCGKSNVIAAMEIVFNRLQFLAEDFSNRAKPIELLIDLVLSDAEIGTFGDFAEPDDETLIKLKVQQTDPESPFAIEHRTTGIEMDRKILRSANFVSYTSDRIPERELKFQGQGVGRLLHRLIRNVLAAKPDVDLLKDDQIRVLAETLNNTLINVKAFTDHDISVEVEKDNIEILRRILVLKEANGFSIADAGSGLQFLTLACLHILDQLLDRSDKFGWENKVFQLRKGGRKSISVLMAFDEPDVHLDPLMQRSLVGHLSEIAENRSAPFRELLRDLLGVDDLDAQVFVITHSPAALTENFRDVVRLYSDAAGSGVRGKCGSAVNLDEDMERHIHLQMPFMKEAFFARHVAIVEGETEFGALRPMAESLQLALDDEGVCVINAGGKNSAIPVMRILSEFGIQSSALLDRDRKSDVERQRGYNDVRTSISWTTTDDFESDIVDHLLTFGTGILKRIVEQHSPGDCTSHAIQPSAFAKRVAGYTATQALRLSDAENLGNDHVRAWFLCWFRMEKCFRLGRLIGETLDASSIPSAYRVFLQGVKRGT